MKYARTPHFPFSPGVNSDDIRQLKDQFVGKEVVQTEKLDGENTSILKGKVHARSENSVSYPWQNEVRVFHASVCHLLDDRTQLILENVTAIHSIEYTHLTHPFYLISVFDLGTMEVMSWEEIKDWAELLDLPTAPLLFSGIWTGKETFPPAESRLGGEFEGYVVRSMGRFPIADFHLNVSKYVRAGHVQTDEHWRANWKKAKWAK